MAVTQVAACALLFPWLMRSAASAIVAIATTWPFIALAGVVSGATNVRLLDTGCYVTAWIIALWAWHAWAPTSSRCAAVAAASLVTIGSLVLFYLALEFGADLRPGVGQAMGRWSLGSPTLASLRRLEAPQNAGDYGIPVAVAAVAAGCRFFARRNRQVIHSI